MLGIGCPRMGCPQPNGPHSKLERSICAARPLDVDQPPPQLRCNYHAGCEHEALALRMQPVSLLTFQRLVSPAIENRRSPERPCDQDRANAIKARPGVQVQIEHNQKNYVATVSANQGIRGVRMIRFKDCSINLITLISMTDPLYSSCLSTASESVESTASSEDEEHHDERVWEGGGWYKDARGDDWGVEDITDTCTLNPACFVRVSFECEVEGATVEYFKHACWIKDKFVGGTDGPGGEGAAASKWQTLPGTRDTTLEAGVPTDDDDELCGEHTATSSNAASEGKQSNRRLKRAQPQASSPTGAGDPTRTYANPLWRFAEHLNARVEGRLGDGQSSGVPPAKDEEEKEKEEVKSGCSKCRWAPKGCSACRKAVKGVDQGRKRGRGGGGGAVVVTAAKKNAPDVVLNTNGREERQLVGSGGITRNSSTSSTSSNGSTSSNSSTSSSAVDDPNAPWGLRACSNCGRRNMWNGMPHACNNPDPIPIWDNHPSKLFPDGDDGINPFPDVDEGDEGGDGGGGDDGGGGNDGGGSHSSTDVEGSDSSSISSPSGGDGGGVDKVSQGGGGRDIPQQTQPAIGPTISL